MKVNIIGDIHGRYDAFLELIEKMPKADKLIAIGDLVDKGDKSFEVVKYFIKNKDSSVLLGNHEVLFLSSKSIYHKDLPYLDLSKRTDFRTGYLKFKKGIRYQLRKLYKNNEEEYLKINKLVASYFASMPLDIKIDNLYISHAPYTMETKDMKNYEDNFYKLFISRSPFKNPNYFSVFGHTGKQRYWTQVKNNNKLQINEIEKPIGKGVKGDAISIDGSPKYLIGINIDTVTLEYKLYVVDGSKEWHKDLGAKYHFNDYRKKLIKDFIKEWDNYINEN